MKFRPEAEIWPVLGEDELKALAEDIEANGQQYPISLFKGDVLDGRNRWLAIEKFCHGRVKPETEIVSPESPIAFVISRNEKRRHLNESQRALAAAKARPFFDVEAKKRQHEGARKGGKTAGRERAIASGPIGPKAIERRARDDAGKAFGVSGRTVERGTIVLKEGSTKLKAAIERGDLSLGKAEQIVKQHKNKRDQDSQVKAIQQSRMVTRVKGLTGEVEWYTPEEYLNASRKVLGKIDVDPASSEQAQRYVKAKCYFTLETDGLKQKWPGTVFLNPPYAMPYVKQFVFKLIEEYETQRCTAGILLTNNATDTEWWHAAACAAKAFCLTRGRISFVEVRNDEAVTKVSPTHGQTFFYFGEDAKVFTEVFSRYGLIATVKQPCNPSPS